MATEMTSNQQRSKRCLNSGAQIVHDVNDISKSNLCEPFTLILLMTQHQQRQRQRQQKPQLFECHYLPPRLSSSSSSSLSCNQSASERLLIRPSDAFEYNKKNYDDADDTTNRMRRRRRRRKRSMKRISDKYHQDHDKYQDQHQETRRAHDHHYDIIAADSYNHNQNYNYNYIYHASPRIAASSSSNCKIQSVKAPTNRQIVISLFCFISLLVWCLFIMNCIIHIPGVDAVDCFKCSSRNGSNAACEDPFHNLNTTRVTLNTMPNPPPPVVYQTPCMAGRKGRDGLFHATACIKLSGTFEKTGESLVVRHCALDSGTLTPDTELARMSHCGRFQFEGDYLKGCVQSCPDDACNHTPPNISISSNRLIMSIILIVGSVIQWSFVGLTFD